MATWQGGPCPQCGDDMPPALIHCQSCRALLNPELETDSVEIPAFMPLQEIETMVEVAPTGHYISCPICSKELRIHGKYRGLHVACKFCSGNFEYETQSGNVAVQAMYSSCPHCSQEIRAATKYLGMKVCCKHCNGKIHLVKN